jgi:hypothetical protein
MATDAGESSSSPSSPLFLRRVAHGQRRVVVEEEEEEEGPAWWWGYSASILDGKGEERILGEVETGGPGFRDADLSSDSGSDTRERREHAAANSFDTARRPDASGPKTILGRIFLVASSQAHVARVDKHLKGGVSVFTRETR